jgi:pyruvate formate lyase activating enzyme
VNTPDASPERDPGLTIAGLARLSVCDWPGRLVATVFLQGCPWHCGYCHNPELIDPRTPGSIGWGEVWTHLNSRRGLLDAVVFSGGEPTRQPSLKQAVEQVRDLGYLVGLHTSGAYPHRFAELLPSLNWVGLDIKGLPSQYPAITGVAGSFARGWVALEMVLAAGVDFEVRTTVDPRFHTVDGLVELIAMLQGKGVGTVVLQEVRLPRGIACEQSAAELVDGLGELPPGVFRRGD